MFAPANRFALCRIESVGRLSPKAVLAVELTERIDVDPQDPSIVFFGLCE